MAQINFNGGEISPRLDAQVDLTKFQSGLAECVNFLPLKEGSLMRRPGTEFIAKTKAQNRPARLFNFIFSEEESYIIEIGAKSGTEAAYIRFFKDGAPIINPNTQQPLELLTYLSNPPNSTLQPIWYEQEDLFKINTLQRFDVMYLFSGVGNPLKLLRFADDNWALHEVYFYKPSSDWSDTKGWPTTGTFYQSRMLLGGVFSEPQKVYASITGIYDADKTDPRGGQAFRESFEQGATADLGWSYTIDTNKYNRIKWMVGTNDGNVLIGTTDSERLMKPTGTGPITGAIGENENIPTFVINSEYGTSSVPAIFIGGTVVAAQKPGNKLRSFDYSDTVFRYIGENLNRLTEHLAKQGKIVAMAYQDEPEQILWVIRDDNSLQSLTFVPEEQVFAWGRHPTKNGKFHSIETKPASPNEGSFTREDEVWKIVERAGLGYYIERFSEQNRDVVDTGPIITPLTGIYQAPITVTIENSSGISDIYYTLDGSLPRMPSPEYPNGHGILYTGPFQISSDVLLKAVNDKGITYEQYEMLTTGLLTSDDEPIYTSDDRPVEVIQ